MKMIRVVLVDDSAFFRKRIAEMLAPDPGISVVGVATNGAEGVGVVREQRPDVVLMDVEMPVMDGITAVRHIMRDCPTPVLMFSALTRKGAKATLDALEAGALDFMAKHVDDVGADPASLGRALRSRLRLLARRAGPVARAAAAPARVQHPAPPAGAELAHVGRRHSVVVIGTSTGGPAALQRILTTLPPDFPLPLLLVQHMPATFTGPFAERLDRLCAIEVREARDGDPLRPGTALLAPGGQQMLVENRGGRRFVGVRPALPGEHYKPSVDLTFASVAHNHPAPALAVVLTGMGADGREGARALRAAGATIWAQDEASCVVYGMPMAIVKASLADRIVTLDEMARRLAEAA